MEHSGRKLGKYEIVSRLSTGGMSEIFLAFQRGLAGFRKHVVLKQILPDIKGEEEFVRMFLDEAKITAAFTHPNIAHVFDLDIQDGELFLAMEFVPGATLVEVARSTRQHGETIPIGFTLMAVRDTALALHYAHTFIDELGRPQQVIHRDIAEKNIMVTYEGVTKLLDFGIAKSLSASSRTHVGMVKGTSGYMSPEQILGEPLDPRSDVFSLGVVLHECLTGMRLFHGKSAEDAMMQALKGEVAPPSRQNPALTPELDAVVLKALMRKRGDRYGTALEFARAIERAAGPSIWHPEQSGELMQRLFAQRREGTRALMSQVAADAVEVTGEFRLAQFLGNEPPPKPPPPVVTPAVPIPIPPVLPPEPTTIRSESTAARPRVSSVRRKARPAEELTTPGIRPRDVQGAPEDDDGGRTIPATSLADLMAKTQPVVRKRGTGQRARVEPPPPPVPDEQELTDFDLQDDDEDEAPSLTDSTDRNPGPSGRKSNRGVWLAAVIVIAVIGGTVFALSLEPPVESEPVAVLEAQPIAPPPSATQPPPAIVVAEEVKPEAEPAATPVPERPEKPKRHRAVKGSLTLVTEPWANVYLGGKSLGMTPLVKVSLPVGRHTLKLIGEDHKPVALTVEIQDGNETRVRVPLSMLKAL